jgi:hypothetical protein
MPVVKTVMVKTIMMKTVMMEEAILTVKAAVHATTATMTSSQCRTDGDHRRRCH